MMASSAKKRFELVDDRVRAVYGHSVDGKVEREQATPPAILYHGTPPDIAAIIRVQGLKPMSRQYVHLSSDVATAREVGLRRSPKPVIFEIDALAAHEAGHAFYIGHDKVWLCDALPASFIRG
jgi:putative RNA 2'-phosphotransferase